jgi:hypothetical protein
LAGLIEQYLEKRAVAVQAEQAMNELTGKVHLAASNLGDGNDRGLSTVAWKRLHVPDVPPSTKRRPGTNQFPTLPTQAELVEKATAYWVAIAAADEAFALLPAHQREGLQPPPK